LITSALLPATIKVLLGPTNGYSVLWILLNFSKPPILDSWLTLLLASTGSSQLFM